MMSLATLMAVCRLRGGFARSRCRLLSVPGPEGANLILLWPILLIGILEEPATRTFCLSR